MLIAFSEGCKHKDVLIALAVERLTSKQKKILIYLSEQLEIEKVARLVPILCQELTCSQSTVWNNLKALKRSKLIDYGNQNSKGLPTKLTDNGEIVSAQLKVRK